ncbi:MAG TPA: hypothetical protein VJB67_02590 [Patescibacteria group bacterium]|nr:hypothetical protein [Patescibacteria group bacterium]
MAHKVIIISIFLPIFVLGGFFVFSHSILAREISGEVVWSVEDSPIIVNEYIWIQSGGRLIIEPGVVVKFGLEQSIANYGVIEAIGTVGEPIVFTSIRDDEYGGDSNGDGDATTPWSGDWRNIILQTDSESVFDHVIIKYGGGEYHEAVVSLWRGQLEINNSIITNNGAGLKNQEGQMTISNSAIYGNYIPLGALSVIDAGIANQGLHPTEVTATGNWWGDVAGPCPWQDLVEPGTPPWKIDFVALCGTLPLIDGGVLYDPWLTSEPTYGVDPVIIIPGILGSWDFGGGWQLDPIFNTYDNLWDALKLAGYEEGETLFALPYDWNKSNFHTAGLLQNKIDEIKEICECDKVDIVAHSMGGLVVRAYIELGYYNNDIDQLIFLAVPHLGASKAYLTWEAGELGQRIEDWVMERVFALLADIGGYNSIFDLVRNYPIRSIEQTLPIYNYLKRQDNDGNWQLIDYASDYPTNEFLEDLNREENLAKLEDIDMTNIVASAGDNSTIDYLRVVDQDFETNIWEHGYPENYYSIFGDHGLENGRGDQTVSARSNSGFFGLEDVEVDSNHNTIMTDAQKIIIKELTGVEPVEEVRNNAFVNYLLVRIFSPADFVVIAPNGKKVGKDFSGSGIINEIENAFYSGFDNGVEFAVIPNPIAGDYQVQLQGTDQGAYRLSVSHIDDDTAGDSDFDSDISINEVKLFSFGLNNEGDISALTPQIYNIDELVEMIEEMYNKGWISHFGNMTALIARLENQPLDDKKIDQLIKFVVDMLAKERLNQDAYNIINLALNNIKSNL